MLKPLLKPILILALALTQKCPAGWEMGACQSSLAEDKPACLQVTSYVPTGPGRFLKIKLAFFAKAGTNAENQLANRRQ
jgi:hypothetical protein